MDDTVKQRIKSFVKYKGISERQFCIEIGASAAFISNIVKSIQPNRVNSITERFPDLNPGWLLTGEGEMLKPPKNNFSQITDRQVEKTIEETITENLLRLLKTGEIYLAEMHDKIVADKNEEIAKRDRRIEEMQRELWELQRKMDEKEK